MRNFRSTVPLGHGLLMFALAMGTATAGCAKRKPSGPLTLSNVTASPTRFDPAAGQTTSIEFTTSAETRVSAVILAPNGGLQGAPVRTLAQDRPLGSGDRSLRWDGRDDAGKFVPPGVYRYALVATSASGERARWDPGPSGGDWVTPSSIEWDPRRKAVVYALPRPARVRIFLGLKGPTPDDFVILRTLVDWELKPAGPNSEPWDGMDASGVLKFDDNPQIGFVPEGYSLPTNSIEVMGASPTSSSFADPVGPQAQSLHSRHPRSRCFNPKLSLTFPKSSIDKAGNPVVDGPTLVRVAVDPATLPRLMGRRSALFMHVDGNKVFRDLNSYSPVNWWWDPKGVSPGTHYLTAIMAWPEDHYGVATARVDIKGHR